MIEQESIKKTFSNFFFCNKRDSCELVFSYGDGFTTKQEAVSFIESIGISPRGFVYFLFKGTWYAVHLNSWQEELVFSKERMWIKYSSVIGAQTEVFDITKAEPAEIREKITFSTATMSGGWHCWSDILPGSIDPRLLVGTGNQRAQRPGIALHRPELLRSAEDLPGLS